jgi:tRNA pseudouridine38-40 synthase
MRNIKLTVAYEGTDFRGWQVQPGQPTVQGALMDLLHRLTGELPALHGAGRTDAGVHAWGQVANFTTESALAPREFARALNALLPPAIRIRDAAEVPLDFHARWLACAKTYRYRIFRGPVVPPFSYRYVLHDSRPLDFAAMAQAARYFEGEHDFSSFAASTGSREEDQERTMVRTIAVSELTRSSMTCTSATYASTRHTSQSEMPSEIPPEMPTPNSPGVDLDGAEEWVYFIRGKSFLRSMVRKIVGTLLEIGRGRLAPEDIARLFELCDHTRSGAAAPPQGLCLVSVEYPTPYAGDLFEEAGHQKAALEK